MPTGNFDTYSLVGVKENVSDEITNISPTATPFLTMIGTSSVHQRTYQWQEDSLQAVAANAQVEGASAPSAVAQATTMRSNTTQIMIATAASTGTTDATDTYGRGKELAYQLLLRSKELKRALENALIGTGQAKVDTNLATARVFAGYQAQCASGGIVSVGVSGTPAALTETSILTLAQNLFNAGAEPSILMVKPSDAVRVAAIKSSGRTDFVKDSDKRITNVVNVYESPFGPLKVVMNRIIRGAPLSSTASASPYQSDALMFDPAMFKRAVLRNWFRETLAKTGDSTQVMIVGEFGLIHKHQQASGFATWLSA